MCVYCEHIDKKSQEAIYDANGIIVQVCTDTPIGKRKNDGGVMQVYDGRTTDVSINFCPMCGRKLNAPKEKAKKTSIIEVVHALKSDSYLRATAENLNSFSKFINLPEEDKTVIAHTLYSGFSYDGNWDNFFRRIIQEGKCESFSKLLG